MEFNPRDALLRRVNLHELTSVSASLQDVGVVLTNARC
jgi:hypothetical protein